MAKKFFVFKESIASCNIAIGDKNVNWPFNQNQIMDLLSDFTDEKCDIRLMDNPYGTSGPCIHLNYFFEAPESKMFVHHEFLTPIERNMDEIVEKLLDCGYNIKYDTFWNSYTISAYSGRGHTFCEIYPKNDIEGRNYNFSTPLDREHENLIRDMG